LLLVGDRGNIAAMPLRCRAIGVTRAGLWGCLLAAWGCGGGDGLPPLTATVCSGSYTACGGDPTGTWEIVSLCVEGDAAAAVEAIAASCGGAVTRLDGVRAEYDGGWALARASITESAITFRFEGRDGREMRRIAEHFLAGAGELRNQVLEKIEE